MGFKKHVCEGKDDDDKPLPPLMVTCGNCHRSWCERCDPAPAAQCPWCNGYGYSTAPIGKRQRIELNSRQEKR